MSMRDYAVDEYGMVLNEEEIYKIAKVLIPTQEWAEEDWDDADTWEFVDRLDDIMSSYSEFSGEALIVKENGENDWDKNTIYRNGDSIFYIPLTKYSTLLTAAYNNLEEAKNEIRERICNAVDVEIHHIIGTYFG